MRPQVSALEVAAPSQAKGYDSPVQRSTTTAAPQYPIESIDNALRLILLLGERGDVRLTEASAHLGVATSTAHRILAMLTWRGFARQDTATKAYGPGPALTTVAFSVLRRLDLPRIAQPLLENLAAEIGETAHLGTLEGDRVRFLAVAEPASAVRVASRLGLSMPAHCTSTGKALLAELSDDSLDRLYPDEHLETVTPKSIASLSQLKEELERVRSDGYATNREESEMGVASVALAVGVSSGLKLALNISAPVFRLPQSKSRSISRKLREAALTLADLLG